jgi:hypothetical protein
MNDVVICAKLHFWPNHSVLQPLVTALCVMMPKYSLIAQCSDACPSIPPFLTARTAGVIFRFSRHTALIFVNRMAGLMA